MRRGSVGGGWWLYRGVRRGRGGGVGESGDAVHEARDTVTGHGSRITDHKSWALGRAGSPRREAQTLCGGLGQARRAGLRLGGPRAPRHTVAIAAWRQCPLRHHVTQHRVSSPAHPTCPLGPLRHPPPSRRRTNESRRPAPTSTASRHPACPAASPQRRPCCSHPPAHDR